MGPEQHSSDNCTYHRKFHRALHNITLTSQNPGVIVRNRRKLVNPSVIGFISGLVILSFAVAQYSLLPNSQGFSDDEDQPGEVFNRVSSPAAAVANHKPVVAVAKSTLDGSNNNNKCNCENSANKTSISKVAERSRPTAEKTEESYSIKKQLEISESIWQRSVVQRHAWIATVSKDYNLSRVNPWDGENYVFFWNYFTPSFNCPHSVQRVGFIGDGGKWVCGLELYEFQSQQQQPKNEESDKKTRDNQMETKETGATSTAVSSKPSCIIYSFGVANESSFEAEMLERTNCQVFAYDYSVKSIGSPVASSHPRVTFRALGIGNKNLGKFRTLRHLMDQNGHDWIDILKMDVEGGEYAALDKVMHDFPPDKDDKEQDQRNDNRINRGTGLPFGQLLLEVHVEGKLFSPFYQWWERLEARGLRAFYSEVNHVACVISKVKPNFVEYSFINIQGSHRLLHERRQ